MPRAVVHIGTHKTGTTSFQKWAEQNRSFVHADSGLRYYHGYFGTNHFEFPLLALRDDRGMPKRSEIPDWRLPTFQQDLRDHITEQLDGDDVLISAEGLSYLRFDDEVERLNRLFDGYTVEYLLVTRKPSDFLRSYRDQMMRLGFPPSSDPSSFAYVEADSWLLDYDALRSTFGDPPEIRYEEAVEAHRSVIPAMLSAIGCSAEFAEAQSAAWVNAGSDEPTPDPPSRPTRRRFGRVRSLRRSAG